MLLHLEASSFRNLEPLRLEFGPGRHLFLGPNGAGKTSLLEAIYLLATTRSFRTPRLTECVRHGERTFRLAGETSERARIEVFLTEEGAGERRERRVNGDRTSLAEHLAELPVISWTAADGEVVSGPPEERRRFMDRGILGLRPAALDSISRYRHALDGKKELLRSGQGRGLVDPVQLDAWNELQAQAAAELVSLRASYVDQLASRLAETLSDADLGLPEVTIDYRPSPTESLGGADAAFAALGQVAAREIALEQPLVGPQRDDLVVRWQGRSAKRLLSAGERKALGLALLIAHGRVLASAGVEPVVLLDDVDVELDPERLARLWTILGNHRQVLVSSARPAVWESIEIDRRWRVEEGRAEAGKSSAPEA